MIYLSGSESRILRRTLDLKRIRLYAYIQSRLDRTFVVNIARASMVLAISCGEFSLDRETAISLLYPLLIKTRCLWIARRYLLQQFCAATSFLYCTINFYMPHLTLHRVCGSLLRLRGGSGCKSRFDTGFQSGYDSFWVLRTEDCATCDNDI